MRVCCGSYGGFWMGMREFSVLPFLICLVLMNKWIKADDRRGWETVTSVHDYLVLYMAIELDKLLPDDEDSAVSGSAPELVDQAIKDAFLRLDNEIMQMGADAALGARFLGEALTELGAGYAGSCALYSIWDHRSKLLRVACTGDSRAVLGRRNAAGEWEAIPLSTDQTGFNESEAARIRAEHPNEPDVIKDGRLLGLAVTRAFGDGRWKWSRDVQDQARKRFYGPALREGCLTPPYLTAEPVITTTAIRPENRDFVIMATDGLWDNLTSEQAVNLVGRWLQIHDPAKEARPPRSPGSPSYPATAPKDALMDARPERGTRYTNRGFARERDFVVVDDNAATHLVRNALGGGNEDRLRGVFTAQTPVARRVK